MLLLILLLYRPRWMSLSWRAFCVVLMLRLHFLIDFLEHFIHFLLHLIALELLFLPCNALSYLFDLFQVILPWCIFGSFPVPWTIWLRAFFFFLKFVTLLLVVVTCSNELLHLRPFLCFNSELRKRKIWESDFFFRKLLLLILLRLERKLDFLIRWEWGVQLRVGVYRTNIR